MKDIVNKLKDMVLEEVGFESQAEINFSQLVETTAVVIKEVYSQVMAASLEEMDDRLLCSKERRGLEPRKRTKRTINTLSGSITYYRRYYKDPVSGKSKFLLDEILGIEPHMRVSADVSQLCAGLNGLGLAYRPISDIVELVLGERVLSHQGVRDHTLAVAEKIRQQDEMASQEAIEDTPKQEVPVLFIEADGFWVSEQNRKKHKKKNGRNSFEIKTVVVHEGWQTRYKKDYQLINPRYYTATTEEEKSELWDQVREDLLRRYHSIDKIQIVINGDGASWIRQGTEYFGNAIYQYDRFHIARDIRRCLRGHPELLKKAHKALQENEIHQVHPLLASAYSQMPDGNRKDFTQEMIARVEKDAEYIVDYRQRIDASIGEQILLRGMGSAEASVKKYKKRLKSVGKAWSKTGAQAMVTILSTYFSGLYADYLISGPVNLQEPITNTGTEKKPLSAARCPAVIKGKKLGKGAIQGRIAPLRGCYSGIAQLFGRITAV